MVDFIKKIIKSTAKDVGKKMAKEAEEEAKAVVKAAEEAKVAEEVKALEKQRRREEVEYHNDRTRIKFRGERGRLEKRMGVYKLDKGYDEGIPDNIKLSSEKIIDEIDTLFKDKYKSLSHAADLTADLTLHTLHTPIYTLANDTAKNLEEAKSDEDRIEAITTEFHEVLTEQRDSIIAAMEKVIAKKGYIDHQALAMLDHRSDMIAQLLARPDNQALLEIFKFANDDSYPEPEHLAYTIKKYLEKPKIDETTKQIVWHIVGELAPADRVKLGRDLKEKMSEQELEEMLGRGNLRGVFSLGEMEEIRGEKYADASERERYNKQFMQIHDMKDKMQQLTDSYGTYNQAGEMLTGANAVGFIFDAGMLLMGATNIAVGVWKDPMGIVKNEYVWTAAAGIAGRHYMKKQETLEVATASEETRITRERETAKRDLTREIRNTTSWEQWDEFFKSDDHNGVEIFANFRDYISQVNDGIPKGVKADTFQKFLDFRAAETQDPQKSAKYQKAKVAFEKISHRDNISRLLGIFKDATENGVNEKNTYNQVIADAKLTRV